MPLAPPRMGEIRGNYRYVGGEPASEASWVDMSSPVGALDFKAPGFAYLPRNARKPNPSTEAGFEKWKMADEPARRSAIESRAATQRAEGLLAKQKTGGVYALPVIGGLYGLMDPEIRELDAIQARAARQERQPGEGAISDFDAQQFLNMSYGKDKPVETNRQLIRAQRARADMQLEHRAFREWFHSTYGNSNGAAEAWARYAQDNSIFDPASEASGSPMLNPNRKAWREYFGAVRTDGDRRQSGNVDDIRRSAASPPGLPKSGKRPDQRSVDGYNLLVQRGVITGRGQRGTRTNPFRAVSAQVLAGLPPGSWVVGPDGRLGEID